MMWVLPLPGYTAPPLNLNQRGNWRAYQRPKRKLQDDVVNIARAVRLPRCDWAHVELHWAPSVVRRRDADNPYPTLKYAVDALVKGYGFLPDDTPDHISHDVVIEPVNKVQPIHSVFMPNGVVLSVGAWLWLTVDTADDEAAA